MLFILGTNLWRLFPIVLHLSNWRWENKLRMKTTSIFCWPRWTRRKTWPRWTRRNTWPRWTRWLWFWRGKTWTRWTRRKSGSSKVDWDKRFKKGDQKQNSGVLILLHLIVSIRIIRNGLILMIQFHLMFAPSRHQMLIPASATDTDLVEEFLSSVETVLMHFCQPL